METLKSINATELKGYTVFNYFLHAGCKHSWVRQLVHLNDFLVEDLVYIAIVELELLFYQKM